eukprot:scaffold2871_cov381-Prasinococcus_capsulatus_cf.AAC.11
MAKPIAVVRTTTQASRRKRPGGLGAYLLLLFRELLCTVLYLDLLRGFCPQLRGPRRVGFARALGRSHSGGLCSPLLDVIYAMKGLGIGNVAIRAVHPKLVGGVLVSFRLVCFALRATEPLLGLQSFYLILVQYFV